MGADVLEQNSSTEKGENSYWKAQNITKSNKPGPDRSLTERRHDTEIKEAMAEIKDREERNSYVKDDEPIDIIKSPGDKRLYKVLKLPNNLTALLISDPETDESAAAVNVGVGGAVDPDELPGLAHFCEHLIFMGSKKYPKENDFEKYLSEHGGFGNGATSYDATMYYFEVNSDYLEGALDRFAQFFICPSFTESAVEREVNAVNLEYERNGTCSSKRLLAVERLMYKKDHSLKKFLYGNKTTLMTIPMEKGIDVRKEIIRFYEKWYSSSIMTLVALGKESLDDLESMVLSSFSDIVNRNVESPEWTDHYFDTTEQPAQCHVVPISNDRELYLLFPIPYCSRDSVYYLTQLMEKNKGFGSLYSYLKTKGWISSSITVDSRLQVRELLSFEVSVYLTEEGIGKINEIINSVFQYINMIKEVSPQKWFYDEYQKISEINFKFKEKESPLNYVKILANNLLNFGGSKVLFGPFDPIWEPETIETLLDSLKPSKVRMIVVGKEFESIADQVEPLYGTKYKMEKIPEDIIKKWEDCGLNEAFKFPSPNKFIPSNFEILYKGEEEQVPPHPLIIYESSLTRLWFKQDNIYLAPRACLIFRFYSFSLKKSEYTSVKWAYVRLFEDSLEDSIYQAKLVNCSYDIRIMYRESAIELVIDGYNDKLDIILIKILEKMANFKVDPQKLERYKKEVANVKYGEESKKPDELAWDYLERLTHKLCFKNENSESAELVVLEKELEILVKSDTPEESEELGKFKKSEGQVEAEKPEKNEQKQMKELEKPEESKELENPEEPKEEMTVDLFEKFIHDFRSNFFIECLMHGNIDESGALSLIRIVENKLNNTKGAGPSLLGKLDNENEFEERVICLNEKSNFLYETTTKIHKNSYVLIYFQCCKIVSVEKKMILELLVDIMREPCFDVLRSKEQLCYELSRETVYFNPFMGLKIGVLTDKPPTYVNQRIEAFLIHFREVLENMTEEQFENFKSALISIRSQKSKDIRGSTTDFWTEICSLHYNFSRAETEVGYLQKVFKSDVLKFFDDHIKYDAPMRRKMSIYVISESNGKAEAQPDLESSQSVLMEPPPYDPPTKIEDIEKFRDEGNWVPPIKDIGDLSSMYARKKSYKIFEVCYIFKAWNWGWRRALCAISLKISEELVRIVVSNL